MFPHDVVRGLEIGNLARMAFNRETTSGNYVRDAAPHRGAVEIILRRKLIGAALSLRASSPCRFSIRLAARQMSISGSRYPIQLPKWPRCAR
jgi:hypothetical protein